MERNCPNCNIDKMTIRDILLCDKYEEQSPCVKAPQLGKSAGNTSDVDGIAGKDKRLAVPGISRNIRVPRNQTTYMPK